MEHVQMGQLLTENRTKVQGQTSKNIVLNHAPQGSVLSPTILLAYINDNIFKQSSAFQHFNTCELEETGLSVGD